MAITPVPLLGTQGFATDSVTKFSSLMAHLFESDANQTQLYPGKITSISKIMEESGTDLSAVQQNLRQALQSYLGRYYSSATVDASIVGTNATKSQITVNLDIRVYDDGQETTVTWQFTSDNNIIVQVLNRSNYGA